MTRPPSRGDYTIGWVCALPVELAAAQEMLDEEHEAPQTDAHDTNIYTCGRVGEHNVVIACLPEGQMGTSSAALVAVQMKSAFTSIRFGLMVGIGGGAPSDEADVRLGDVVVSKPYQAHGGVVQYDSGKTTPSGLKRTGSLNAPPIILLNAIANVRARHIRGRYKMLEHFSTFDSLPEFSREAAGPDTLFKPEYSHEGGATCSECKEYFLVTRKPRKQEVAVHYGTIASGNQVMRDAVERDKVSAELGGVLCFEMEAAGLMNSFPCLVIRGICDYADSHKNKKWQAYAAGMAAAYAKEILLVIPPTDVAKSHTVEEAIRVTSEEEKTQHECIQQLRLTDPRDDKRRIENTKGGLLKDSYRWILYNRDFREWRYKQQSRLLWIKGDPGKGKTMLLCGIANELKSSIAETDLLCYFFCQATDARINNATAVLRGLLFLLVDQQPSLISHVRKKYDSAGKALFEDINAWAALSEIFEIILQDPSLNNTYLIVDALDECVDLPKLLDFIVQQSISCGAKWIISSRNWPDIEERLEQAGHKVRLCLELNTESISTAVDIFIQHKVLQLAHKKKYDRETQTAVFNHLSLNANNTFLWVALICQLLDKTPRWNALANIDTLPPGLDSLYERMMQQITKSESANLCLQVLGLVATAYRPITLVELATLVEQLENIAGDLESVREVVGFCYSFLTIQKDTIYFVHQSAKDFLFAKAFDQIFPSGIRDVHHRIYSRSLQVLSTTLRRDMYSLNDPGYPIEQIISLEPDSDPLAALGYSCIHWIDHLCDWGDSSTVSSVDLQVGGLVYEFIRKKYLYWLEALSLYKCIPVGVVSMAKLEALIQETVGITALIELVQDALRFIMYHQVGIEKSPLQVYESALLFSPINSQIRRLFKHEEPKNITIKPAVEGNWNSCFRTLEGHSGGINSGAFSYDSTLLASASDDSTIRIWGVSSGQCLRTLNGHSDRVWSVAFSHDSTRLVSASDDSTVKVWDANSGQCLRTLNGHSNRVWSVAFSHDSTRLASASEDYTIKIWDVSSGHCLRTLEGLSGWARSVAFSHDSNQLASALSDSTVKIWDASSGDCLRTLEGHSHRVCSVTFSHSSSRLASASEDCTIKVWDASSGHCLQTFEGHSNEVRSVAFSPDSTRLASASADRTVKIWDASSRQCLQTLEGHSDQIWSVVFSHDSTRLASVSDDHTVRIWDASSDQFLQILEGHNDEIGLMAFSHDSTQLVSASDDGTIKVWDTSSGQCLQTLEGHGGRVESVAFSHSSTWLASASDDHTVRIWDVSSGHCLRTLKGHSDWVRSVAFSHDSTRLVSASDDCTVKMWDASSGHCLRTLEGHIDWVRSVAFSHDSTRLASASDDRTVKVWDTSSGQCLWTLKGHSDWVGSVTFSHDSTRLASASTDRTVKVWDTSSGQCLQTLEGHGNRARLVAFSHDSTRLASASDDEIVKIWDSSSDQCLQTLNVGIKLHYISFDGSNSKLYTDAGTIDITTPSSSAILPINPLPQSPRYQGLALGVDNRWLTYCSKNVLWLPIEYRPARAAFSNKTLGIGAGSGKVWICKVEYDTS